MSVAAAVVLGHDSELADKAESLDCRSQSLDIPRAEAGNAIARRLSLLRCATTSIRRNTLITALSLPSEAVATCTSLCTMLCLEQDTEYRIKDQTGNAMPLPSCHSNCAAEVVQGLFCNRPSSKDVLVVET